MLYEVLTQILQIAYYIIIAHLIMSWLIQFQVLNLRQPFVAKVWFGLNRLLEPIYGPIRRALPDMGGIDLSPMVVLIGLIAIREVLARNVGLFG